MCLVSCVCVCLWWFKIFEKTVLLTAHFTVDSTILLTGRYGSQVINKWFSLPPGTPDRALHSTWVHFSSQEMFFFFTFAPGIARLFFRVRDNSILPPRLPTCTGSNGIEEYIGSVNWGWGSHIILGFQLGESFGSVCCKKKRRRDKYF